MTEYDEIIESLDDEPCVYSIRNLTIEELQNDIETLTQCYRHTYDSSDCVKLCKHLAALKRELFENRKGIV